MKTVTSFPDGVGTMNNGGEEAMRGVSSSSSRKIMEEIQPERTQERNNYMDSQGFVDAMSAENMIVIGNDPPKHGAFMSTMAELRPGLSDAQRRRDRQQRELLRSELENQVLEKKKRAAREKAEQEARDAQEEEEIRRYHEKLKERQKREEQRRLNSLQPATNSLQGNATNSQEGGRSGTVESRDQRIIGVMVPPKQSRKETGARQLMEKIPATRSPAQCLQVPEASSSRASSHEDDGMSQTGGHRTEGKFSWEDLGVKHHHLDQLRRETAQIRQDMDRLAEEFKAHSLQPRQSPKDRQLEAERTIQATQSYLTKQTRSTHKTGKIPTPPKLESLVRPVAAAAAAAGVGLDNGVKLDPVPEYFMVTSHLLSPTTNVIPDVLPVPLETEWSQVDETGGVQVGDVGHNENHIYNPVNYRKSQISKHNRQTNELSSTTYR